ncbi:MAG TPA: hypothetical protein VGH82_16900 [Gaiellaceae bacterium]
MFTLAALAASVVLQAGQVQWFMPGVLQPGQKVLCSVAPHVFAGRVPAAGGTDWAWKGGGRMSIQRAPNGAVEAACNAELAGPRIPTMPYVIGQNGVALIRGANHFSQLEKRYGRLTSTQATAGTCTVAWQRAGLQATFTSCGADAVLVRATVTSTRWSSLTGVRIGDPVARVLFEAPYTKRLGANRWRLAMSHRHSLVAEISQGRVARFVATLG